MALLLILMVDSQTRTEVLGTAGGPGVVWAVPQEAAVVGTLMAKGFVVVAGAPNLTTISGQMMTFQVVREDPPVAVHHLPVAAHLTVAVVAHHPSVSDHRPSVIAHHHTVVVVAARPLEAGTEPSVVLASHAGNQGTEHQTAQTSRQCGRRAACLPAAWGNSVWA